MDCDHVREVVSAHLDGELDPPRSRELEEHCENCPPCGRLVKDMRRCSDHIVEGGRVPAPADLAQRIRASLARERAANQPARPLRQPSPWQMAAAALILCLLSAGGGWLVGSRGAVTNAATDQIERDVVASHMRFLVQGMPMQVATNDTHNVKPWFAGRVEFSPVVKDLSANNFELVGGRLDYVAGRRVGVVVYKRRQHWIDVYAWPADAPPAALAASVKGYNVMSWSRDGLVYWAISDLNSKELAELPRLL